MSTQRDEVLAALNELLQPHVFKDYGYNGLQVSGKSDINCIASSPTASRAAIEAAIAGGADALLVHHGVIWGGVDRVDGLLRDRLALLLGADCNLLAYHLPLDAHPEVGNSRKALDAINVPYIGGFASYKGQDIGRWGEVAETISVAELSQRCEEAFKHPVVHCPGRNDQIKRIGVVTGGGQSYLLDAHAAGLDALITGEASEQTWHEAAESGCHAFSCGHYATENLAVHTLASDICGQFGLKHLALPL